MLKQAISYSVSAVYSAFLLCIRTIECGLLAPRTAWNLMRCCFGYFEDTNLALGVPPSFFTDFSVSITSSQARNVKKNHLSFYSYLPAPMLFIANAYKKTTLLTASTEQTLHARLRSIMHVILFTCVAFAGACIMTLVYTIYYALWHINNTQKIFKARVQKNEVVHQPAFQKIEKDHSIDPGLSEPQSKEHATSLAPASSTSPCTSAPSPASLSSHIDTSPGPWTLSEMDHSEHLDQIATCTDTRPLLQLENVTTPKWLQDSLDEISFPARLLPRMDRHAHACTSNTNIVLKPQPQTIINICMKLKDPDMWKLFEPAGESHVTMAKSFPLCVSVSPVTADKVSPPIGSHGALTQKSSQHDRSEQGRTSKTVTTENQKPSAFPLLLTYKP